MFTSINPYEPPTSEPPLQAQLTSRVTVGHFLTAVLLSAATGFVIWIGGVILSIVLFGDTSSYWPGWVAAAPALALGLFALRSSTFGLIGKAIAKRVSHFAWDTWAIAYSILAAILSGGLLIIVAVIAIIFGNPLGDAIEGHYRIALFLLLPGFLLGCIGLIGGVYRRQTNATMVAFASTLFCGGYSVVAVWKIIAAS